MAGKTIIKMVRMEPSKASKLAVLSELLDMSEGAVIRHLIDGVYNAIPGPFQIVLPFTGDTKEDLQKE